MRKGNPFYPPEANIPSKTKWNAFESGSLSSEGFEWILEDVSAPLKSWLPFLWTVVEARGGANP